MCEACAWRTEERNLSLQYLSVVLYPQLLLNYEPDDSYKHPILPAHYINENLLLRITSVREIFIFASDSLWDSLECLTTAVGDMTGESRVEEQPPLDWVTLCWPHHELPFVSQEDSVTAVSLRGSRGSKLVLPLKLYGQGKVLVLFELYS